MTTVGRDLAAMRTVETKPCAGPGCTIVFTGFKNKHYCSPACKQRGLRAGIRFRDYTFRT